MAIEWKGVLPAVTTNFTADDELDLPMFIRNLLFQVEAGVDGIVIGGSLGEASTLTPEEKEKLV
ncbi:MAG TPA: dihydrodipicolinate synthase family protein, partial [Puia sp.]|nr:dihydrodipicolinate synthase family protein [Puia sp.]